MTLEDRIELTRHQLRAKLQRRNLQTIQWNDAEIDAVLKEAFENQLCDMVSWGELRDMLNLPSSDNDKGVVKRAFLEYLQSKA